MEGSQWFRLGVIIAMFLGSFYVLLPTILQEDPSAAFEQKAGEVGGSATTTGGSTKALREFRLTVVEGEAEQIAPALSARLKGAGLQVDDVLVDGRDLVVRRKLVVTDEQILAQLGPAPAVTLATLGVQPDEGAPSGAFDLASLDAVKALADQPAVGQAVPAVLRSATSSSVELAEPLANDPGPMALVVDGVVRGVVVMEPPAEEGGELVSARWAPLGGYDTLGRDLSVVPLPGRVQAEGAAVAEDDGTESQAAESSLPEWLRAILPDTRMPLGLDLQGGIDLTIQVELDEALLSQANRDLTYLDERAKEKGLVIDETRRDKYAPILELRSATADSSTLTSFFNQTMQGQYDYLDTLTDDAGTWHRFVMTDTRQSDIRSQAVTQILDVLRRRVADTKVRDPVVVQKGGGKISVQLPGLADNKTAVAAIGKTAVLEFRLVDPEFRQAEVLRLLRQAEKALPANVYLNDAAVNEWLWDNTDFPKDRIVLFEYEDDIDEETGAVARKRSYAYPLVKAVVLSGQDVNGADVQFDSQTQQPGVSLEFKPAGSAVFCDFTGAHVNDRFAIILDGVVQSAPNINERICGGRARITMGQSVTASQEAKALAVVLRTGSLNAPVSIGSVRVIGPQLGKDAIQAGSIATVFGGLVVLIFMALWYRGPGLIANVALVLNVMLMLAGLSLFGWTLTLPGIAGIALTIGMAVDANIIIYERIREEIKMGQNARKAVETGFKKAAVAVLDSNITTAIAGVVLFSYGDVTIQGFAVTLLMGIGTTLITALFVTRALLEIVTRRATARLRI